MKKPKYRTVIFLNESLSQILADMQLERTRSYSIGQLAPYQTLVKNPHTNVYHGCLGFVQIAD